MDNKNKKEIEIKKAKIEEIRFALESLGESIEKIEEYYKSRLKYNKKLMALSLTVLGFVMVSTTLKKSINALDVFSISLMVVSTYSMMKENISFKAENEADLKRFRSQ